jgi:hypothetical protein
MAGRAGNKKPGEKRDLPGYRIFTYLFELNNA